jgi:hypothetical protein
MITRILSYFQHIPNLCNRFIIIVIKISGSFQKSPKKSLTSQDPWRIKRIKSGYSIQNLMKKGGVLWKLH